MNDVATTIGSMFLASGGEAVATCPRTAQTKGKAGKQAFADTEPLARLREEARSNKKVDSADDIRDTEAGAVDTRGSEPEVESARPDEAAKGGQSEPVSKDDGPVQESVASVPVVAPPVDEVVVEGEVSSGEVELAKTLAPPEAAVSDGVVSEETAKAVAGSAQGRADATAPLPGVDVQEPVAGQTTAQSYAVEGQPSAPEVDTVVATAQNRPEGSDGVTAKGEAATNSPLTQDPSSGKALGNGESKAVPIDRTQVVAERQSGESASVEIKTVAQGSGETAVQAKSAELPESAVSVKPQQQGQVAGESTSDDAKTADTEKTPATIRESLTAERNPNAMRQEDAQTSSQQDGSTRPQSQGPVQDIAASKPAQDAPATTSGQSVQADVELTAVSQDGSTDASPRISTEVVGPAGLDVAGTRSPVQDVGQQILDSIHASIARADRQVQIRLDPPELGTVTVRITEQGDQIQGILQVSRDDTRREIEQALPQVLKGLQDAGIQVRRLEVVVSDQPDRGLGRDQLQQDAWAQQQQQQNADQGYRPQNTGGRNWSARAGFQQSQAGSGGLDSSHAQGAQDRIDMLM